jgi:hypothetical protein
MKGSAAALHLWGCRNPLFLPGVVRVVRGILACWDARSKTYQVEASMILARGKGLQRLQLKKTRRRIHV